VIRSLAHFRHIDGEVAENMVKTVIKGASDFQLQNLIEMTYQLTDGLYINNQTLLEITKNRILELLNEGRLDDLAVLLKPTHCGMVLVSFAECDNFDVDLFYAMEHILIQRIGEASGPELVKIFEAHSFWAQKVFKVA
jgi:hypothetical protein